MLSIDDLNKIINLPIREIKIPSSRLKAVDSFVKETESFVDNLNMFDVDSINKLRQIFESWYSITQNPWLKNKCIITLMGDYNAGKSTFLNSLVNASLPVGNIPITAIPTYIAYGNCEEHLLKDSNGLIREISPELEAKLTHEETSNFDLKRIIDHTILYRNEEVLRKITFIDTPGISANNEYDYSTTAEVASKCDVVLWAIRATAGGIHENEIKFIREHLKNVKLYFIITHSDRVPSPGKILDSLKTQLQEANVQYCNLGCFGKQSTRFFDQQKELESIHRFIDDEVLNFVCTRPQERLDRYLNAVLNCIKGIVSETIKVRQSLEANLRAYERQIDETQSSLDRKATSLGSCIARLETIIEQQCSNVRFCTGDGGTYTDICRCRADLVKDSNELITLVKQLDLKQLIKYGENSKSLANVTEKLNFYVAAQNTCVKIINKADGILQ